jgi:hypothetical protein
MASKAEVVAARSLRSILATVEVGAHIPESADRSSLEAALEHFLPEVLADVYRPHWDYEAFDGFSFAIARKTGPTEAEFLGLGLIISDQTWTPLRTRLRVAPKTDTMPYAACDVGDGGAGGKRMTRLPWGSSRVPKFLYFVSKHANEIDWAFSAVRE